MGRRANAALHEAWRARIAQQALSGLTVAAFCYQAGISARSFHQWRRRLSRGPQGVPPGRQAGGNCRELGCGRGRPQGRSLPQPDVWRYVKDVLDQLLGGCTDYHSLLPWNWAQQHSDAIRQYRIDERRDRLHRQRTRRAARRRLKS